MVLTMLALLLLLLLLLLPALSDVVETFNYTGVARTWTCPSWVTSIDVVMTAGQGAACTISGCGAAGRGGRVEASLAVIPNTNYTVFVGGQGLTVSPWGGTPGGGGCSEVYHPDSYTAGGGGLSLFGPSAAVTTAWLVAGAGGGSGTSGAAGGSGGGTVGGVGGGSNPGSGGTVGNYVGQGQGGTG